MRHRWTWSIVLLASVACGQARDAATPSNVHGVVVFGTEKGGLTGWFGAPEPVSGTVDVLGPFTAAEANAHLNDDEGPVLTTVGVDANGHFTVALAPGRYVLVGHPPHEEQYLGGDLSQRRAIVVPRRGVLKVRLLLDIYYP